MTTDQRIAIARILSDMIMADNIIEKTEIEMLSKRVTSLFIHGMIGLSFLKLE